MLYSSGRERWGESVSLKLMTHSTQQKRGEFKNESDSTTKKAESLKDPRSKDSLPPSYKKVTTSSRRILRLMKIYYIAEVESALHFFLLQSDSHSVLRGRNFPFLKFRTDNLEIKLLLYLLRGENFKIIIFLTTSFFLHVFLLF